MLMGELSLDGSILPIKGALPIAIKAREEGFKGLIIPKANVREAAVVNHLDVYGVENITEVIRFSGNILISIWISAMSKVRRVSRGLSK